MQKIDKDWPLIITHGDRMCWFEMESKCNYDPFVCELKRLNKPFDLYNAKHLDFTRVQVIIYTH